MSRIETRKRMQAMPAWKRAALVRELGMWVANHNPNRDIRRLGWLLLEAVNDGDPDRFMKDCGLTMAGSASDTIGHLNRRRRDLRLRDLARSHVDYWGLTSMAVARKMIKSFENYEARRWPRDRDDGTPPRMPEYLWNWMLREGLKMPKTPWHLAQIIENKNQI